MRAYSKHKMNQLNWERTADVIRHMRKKLILRDCQEKDKLGNNHCNLKRNPASLRSLVEVQAAFESSALDAEDQKLLNNSRFGMPSSLSPIEHARAL